MNQPAPDKRNPSMPGNPAGTIKRERSMVVISNGNGRQKSHATTTWTRFCEKIQSTPLAYKLSFFITVLVVSCMILLGIIIVGQQTGQLRDQIGEQGHTLVNLMAQSAKEPLLADDKLALDTITGRFSNNGSVLGTAIVALNGDIISKAGVLHEE
ncbi:MAG: hypothetical protein QNL87_12345, partial [Gammaproteobacteria bacterium]|nr:hypothetical protein [Gammaproteobacteria bacterium]